MLFLERLRQSCVTQPSKVALEFVDDRFVSATSVTYGELEQNVLRTMALLRGFLTFLRSPIIAIRSRSPPDRLRPRRCRPA